MDQQLNPSSDPSALPAELNLDPAAEATAAADSSTPAETPNLNPQPDSAPEQPAAADLSTVDSTTYAGTRGSLGTLVQMPPNPTQAAIYQQLLEHVKSRLSDAWNNRFSQAHRELMERIVQDATMVLPAILAGDREEWLPELRQINAQLANITAYNTANLQREFWAAANDFLTKAMSKVLAVAVTVA